MHPRTAASGMVMWQSHSRVRHDTGLRAWSSLRRDDMQVQKVPDTDKAQPIAGEIACMHLDQHNECVEDVGQEVGVGASVDLDLDRVSVLQTRVCWCSGRRG